MSLVNVRFSLTNRAHWSETLNLIVANYKQFYGPALIRLDSVMSRDRVLGADVDTLSGDQVIRLSDAVRDVIEENAETFARLNPPGSHDDCAMGLQNGLNVFGLADEMAWQTPILERGGTIVLPCPACMEDGDPHILEVRQAGGQFLVFAADAAEEGSR